MPTRVAAAVIERDGRYLVCQRPAGKHHAGLWEFPGGKLEKDESLAAALRRELAEELGVAARALGAVELRVDEPGSELSIEFVRAEISGEPTALEHAAVKWATLEELRALPLAPSDRRYLEERLAR